MVPNLPKMDIVRPSPIIGPRKPRVILRPGLSKVITLVQYHDVGLYLGQSLSNEKHEYRIRRRVMLAVLPVGVGEKIYDTICWFPYLVRWLVRPCGMWYEVA
jgi:hypothetical protein